MYLSKNTTSILLTVLFVLFVLFILTKIYTNLFTNQIGVWNGVSIYSNKQYENDETHENYYNGMYTGIKWQCVEYARRYLIITRGITFSNVTSAFQIPYAKFTTLNGNVITTTNNLQIGSLIVWPKHYELNMPHGHVAVVSSITPRGITVVEQNYNNDKNLTHRFISWNKIRNTTTITV